MSSIAVRHCCVCELADPEVTLSKCVSLSCRAACGPREADGGGSRTPGPDAGSSLFTCGQECSRCTPLSPTIKLEFLFLGVRIVEDTTLSTLVVISGLGAYRHEAVASNLWPSARCTCLSQYESTTAAARWRRRPIRPASSWVTRVIGRRAMLEGECG
jgi:hypothetical protein